MKTISKEAAHILRKHNAEKLSDYHYRVIGKIDIWPTARKIMTLWNNRVIKYEDLDQMLTYLIEIDREHTKKSSSHTKKYVMRPDNKIKIAILIYLAMVLTIIMIRI